MVFVPKVWKDKPIVTTPITADELNRLEQGIVEGTQAASEIQAGNVELASAAEMTTGTDLTRPPSVKRVVDYVTAYVAANGGGGSSSPASEVAAGIVELASAAEMTTGTDLERVPSVKRVVDYIASVLSSALTGKANISGSITQFADVGDAVPTDGDILRYSSSAAQYLALDPSTQFAEVGADGRIVSSAQPQFYVPALIINEGATVPGTFPSGGVVFTRPSGGGDVLVPAAIGQNAVVNTTAITVATTQDLAVGDYLVVAIAASSEDTGTTPTVTFSAGAAPQTLIGTALATATVRVTLLQGRVTTTIPAGTNVTITLAQSTGRIVSILAGISGLVSSSVLDALATVTGSSNSTLAKTVGPTSITTAANEIALQAYAFNAGTVAGGNNRTFDSSAGWIGLSSLATTAGSSERGLHLGYKVLSTTGAVTGNAQVTSADGASGAWAGIVATLKKA